MGSYLTFSFKYLSVHVTSDCMIEWIACEGAGSSAWIGELDAELWLANIRLSTPGRINADSSLEEDVEFRFSETSADVTGSGLALL